MDIKIQNEVVYCTINKGLIAPNIKEMVEIMKKNFEKEDSYDKVLIDLSQSESIDSMGITFLIGVYKTMLAKQKKVALKGIPNAMLELFKIMKLDEVFEIEK